MVDDLVGKPFRNKGRDVNKGMDCWGLVIEVFRRYGMEVPDFDMDAFSYVDINELAQKELGTRGWMEVPVPQDKDAPLVVLMRMHPSLVTHAGIYLGRGRIMHTTKATGVVVSKAQLLRRIIAGYYRYANHN